MAVEADSIVAIVTPPGEGGVGIVRVSGPAASSLAQTLFPGMSAPWRSHQMRYGDVVDPSSGRLVDQALGCMMLAPRSYTGEDVLEIQCHGSPLVLEHVVRLCLRGDCRAARPGEFTLRAFLNGRLELSQAEAVIDVVRARSNAALDLAMRQLGGWLSVRVQPLYAEALGVLAHMEAAVDFVEDDIPARLDHATRAKLVSIRRSIHVLLEGSEQGIVVREGAALALIGSPNVGKSSVMNALLGADRSIVTPVAGTTRDTVTETVEIRGIPFRIVDTAGIVDTEDVVERIGVERSRQTLASADVVLLILDRSRDCSDEDHLAIAAVREVQRDGDQPRVVVALNKSDLPSRLNSAPLLEMLDPVACVESSAVLFDGVEAIRQALETVAFGGTRHEFLAGNVRHHDALRRAGSALEAAEDGVTSGVPLDLVSYDVRAAVTALGEITGACVDEELLDRIFRDFCIGK